MSDVVINAIHLAGLGASSIMPLAIAADTAPAPHTFTYDPDAGTATLTGTVKVKGSPANAPLWRRVCLIEQTSGRVIRETWSDPASGAYAFANVLGGHPYTVISFDHEGQMAAVIADNLQAL